MRKLVVVLLVIMSACKGDFGLDEVPPSSAEFTSGQGKLLSGQWKLESFETGRISENTLLEFKKLRNSSGKYILSGISALNFYEAAYEFKGDDSIKISDLSMTGATGTPEKVLFEKQYFDRLATVTSFSFKGNTLILKTTQGQQLSFRLN